ncbi:MAG: cytochrome c, partial [Nonlabens sp.]|nr:cytochrome c [Nonlabens sp.]
MKKSKLHFITLKQLLLAIIIMFSFTGIHAQDAAVSQGEPAPEVEATLAADPIEVASEGGADAAAGEALFKANCAACHKLYKRAVGPALHQVSGKYEKEWLYKWIKNSAALIATGDARANAIYEEYGKSKM